MTILTTRIIPFALRGVILYTWLFNRSGGSLLIVMLFHSSANTFDAFIPTHEGITPWAYYIVSFILAIAVIIKDRMWERLPNTKEDYSSNKSNETPKNLVS